MNAVKSTSSILSLTRKQSYNITSNTNDSNTGTSHNGWYSAVIDATIPLDDGAGLSDGAKLSQALDLICAQATSAIETQNAPIIVLSHENVSETRVAVRSSNNSLVIIHVSTIDHVHRYPHLLQSVLYINIFFEHD